MHRAFAPNSIGECRNDLAITFGNKRIKRRSEGKGEVKDELVHGGGGGSVRNEIKSWGIAHRLCGDFNRLSPCSRFRRVVRVCGA